MLTETPASALRWREDQAKPLVLAYPVRGEGRVAVRRAATNRGVARTRPSGAASAEALLPNPGPKPPRDLRPVGGVPGSVEVALLRPDADELPTDRSQVDQRVPDRKAPHQIPRASHHVRAVQAVPDDCILAARDQPAPVGRNMP
jgi:hypothetical protein